MPLCSHGVPFENKCQACFKSAMALYPAPIQRPSYPVEFALKQIEPMIHVVTNEDLMKKVPA